MLRSTDCGRSDCRIALDDFGTGYSSLSYITRFPPDRIKIDKAFIKNVDRSAGDAAVASTILSLGQSLGVTVTAEGIERAGQLEWLRARGCDEIQGFLLSRPPIRRRPGTAVSGAPAAHGRGHTRLWVSTLVTGLTPQQIAEFGCRRRFIHIETLHGVAGLLPQEGGLSTCLNPVGYHRQAQGFSQRNYGLGDEPVVGIGFQIAQQERSTFRVLIGYAWMLASDT